MNEAPKTLAVVGLGLIGASIAEATRKRYPGWRILGVSSPETVREALKLELIDEGFGYGQATEALGRCDVGFLCTPIDRILELLRELAASPRPLKPGAVISDVGSTKQEICALGEKAFPPGCGGVFIGSHPMAGSERTGLSARDAHLFENAAWILCRGPETPAEAMRNLREFIQGLGARSLDLNPEAHDYAVAWASHLPQMLSTALAALVANQASLADLPQVAGAGFRDMTRLAASSHAVWKPILRSNREHLLRVLPLFRGQLEAMENALPRADGAASFFADANRLRERLNLPRKGFTSPLTEILVDLEDRPGALLAVLAPLAEAGINVLDLEILKVREGEEGVLMMGFRKPDEAQAALDCLATAGHKARLR